MNDQGTLTITTRKLTPPQVGALDSASSKSRPHVAVMITDTGTGMDAETIDRAFDPFFTTKEEGKGTGLGLYMVAQTAKKHGGWVTIDSAIGKGTTVSMYLPAATNTSIPMISAMLEGTSSKGANKKDSG